MQRFLFFILLLAFSSNIFGNQGQYKLDQQQIDALFNEATEVNMASFADFSMPGVQGADKMISISDEKEPIIAWLFTMVPIGGVHRVYLGTEAMTFVAYVLTYGGCGIVQFIDWVVLIISISEDDVSDYVDNPKFFMW